jgi:mannose-1-phosphate guanylyltransferase/mannose-6-phosphate isomerase
MTYPITPVILAGGSGTRLWPVSRQSYPKQFCTLFGNKSLFLQTALRLRPTNRLHFAPPITVTHNAFRFTVAQHFQHIDIDPGPILIEPSAKNTAPAILAACFYASQSDPDAVLLICPSDHAIADTEQFHDAILAGCDAVAHGQMVTFGIKPTCQNTAMDICIWIRKRLTPLSLLKSLCFNPVCFLSAPNNILFLYRIINSSMPKW